MTEEGNSQHVPVTQTFKVQGQVKLNMEPIRTQQADNDKRGEAESDEPETPRGVFYSVIRPCLGEFCGQALFIYMVCMTSNADPNSAPALAVGLALFVAICWFGHISGGHFNPAVTLAVTLAGELHPLLALGYFISQLLGACVSGLCYMGSVTATVYNMTGGGSNVLNIGPDAPLDSAGKAVLIEMLLTTILVLTVLSAAVDKVGSKSFITPLCVGLSVSLDAMIGGAYTGASMNPARSLGPAVVYSSVQPAAVNPWTHHWVYWVGPLLGSLLAVLLYKLFFAEASKLWANRIKFRLPAVHASD